MFLSFAIITNAPLTGFILGLKYAPVKVIILPIAITMACSYLTYKLLKLENIYHKLEKRINGYKRH